MDNKQIFINKWDVLEYLGTYYKTVEQDELATIQWVVNVLKREIRSKSRVLVYGIGPAIKDIVPIAPYVSEIDISDYNPDNLAEIKRWVLNDSAMFSWTPFIQYCLQCEGVKSTNEVIIQREQIIREKIRRYIISDADHIPDEIRSLSNGEGFRAPYDLVVSLYCVDSSTSNKEVWKKRMRNMAHLVAKGGLFITAAIGNTSYYDVGRKQFPSANVSQDDLENILKLDFLSQSVRVKEVSVKGHGYNSVIFAHARKDV